MTYDPGMCDTFTADEPPWRFYIGDREVTDRIDPELAEHLADDAILAGILRKAVNGRPNSVTVRFYTSGGRLSVDDLQITKTERDALRRAARPLQ